PSPLTVLTPVVIPARHTTTYFPVTVVDDTETDGPQQVTITAHAAGFTDGSADAVVTDHDVFSYTFSQIPRFGVGVTSTVPFVVTVSALDVNGNSIADYRGPTYLTAIGDLGSI